MQKAPGMSISLFALLVSIHSEVFVQIGNKEKRVSGNHVIMRQSVESTPTRLDSSNKQHHRPPQLDVSPPTSSRRDAEVHARIG
jgi:hypothetical protein